LRAFYYEQGIGTARDPERAAAEYVTRAGNRGGRPRHDARDDRRRRAALGQETALAFQAILQERGCIPGALDAQVGPGTLGAARALAPQ
jgi:hypothetical protein